MENPINVLKYELNEFTKMVTHLKVKIAKDSKKLEEYEESVKRYKNAINLIEGKGDGDTIEQAKAYKC